MKHRSEREAARRARIEEYRSRSRLGRWLTDVGSLLLLSLSGYELYIRLDDCRAWLSGLRHLSERLDIPFIKIMSIMLEDAQMKQLWYILLFLACCVLFSLLSLSQRRRRTAALVLILPDALLLLFGIELRVFDLSFGAPLQWLKLVPMSAIAVGSLCNTLFTALALRLRRGRHARDKETTDAEDTRPAPVRPARPASPEGPAKPVRPAQSESTDGPHK